MILLLSLLFVVATLLSGVAAYGARPRPSGAEQSWPWWVWVATVAAALLMLLVIPAIALLSAP